MLPARAVGSMGNAMVIDFGEVSVAGAWAPGAARPEGPPTHPVAMTTSAATFALAPRLSHPAHRAVTDDRVQAMCPPVLVLHGAPDYTGRRGASRPVSNPARIPRAG